MPQGVTRRPPTAETRVYSRVRVHVGLVMDNVPLEQVFLKVLWHFPVTIIPPELRTCITSEDEQ